MVTLSQSVCIWNHNVAHFKYIQLILVNYTSIKLKKKEIFTQELVSINGFYK